MEAKAKTSPQSSGATHMRVSNQRRIRRAAAMALAVIGLGAASPALAKKEPSPPVEYGPVPTWERFQELAERAVRARLVDPYSAMFEWPWGFRQGFYKPFMSKRINGYYTCGKVNARNRMGGYTGSTYFVVVIDNDTVLYVDMARTSYDSVSEGCAGAGLPPTAGMATAEAEPPRLATPDHGMVLLADPAGLYVFSVASGGRSASAGVKPGMIITRINGIALKGVNEPVAAQIVTNLSLAGTVKFEMSDGALITLERP